jgi:GntR family transcriptional regulator
MTRTQAPTLDERLPRYQQLRDLFVAAVSDGHWRPGEAIPAEDVLAATHGVAVGTVRKALAGLVAEGMLERKQGRGTFVRRGNFGNALARFFRMTDENGRPIRPASRILARAVLPATAEVAEHLGVADGTEVIGLTRLRLAEGVPILAEEVRLRRDDFAPLLELKTDEFGDLLYPLYERVCGKVVASARETIRFAVPPENLAGILGLATGTPAVVIDRVAYGFDNAPLEFRRSYGPAERFSYSIDIR